MKPSNELEHLREHLESLLGLSRSLLSGEPVWRPACDAFESGDEFVVRLDLAGVAREDLSVTTEGRILRVRGHRPDGLPEGPKVFHKLEIHSGPFERHFHLPQEFEGGEPTAILENGILCVRLKRRPRDTSGGTEVPIA